MKFLKLHVLILTAKLLPVPHHLWQLHEEKNKQMTIINLIMVIPLFILLLMIPTMTTRVVQSV